MRPSKDTHACRVCGRSPTIEAHLMPRAFFHDMKESEKHLLVGSSKAPGQRIVQSGLADHAILCASHDSEINAKYDSYGIEFCRSFPGRCEPVAPDIWRLHDVDTDKLARFWLSILWRFSISNIPEAKKVQLGPFEEKARRILFDEVRFATDFPVLIFRYRTARINERNICVTPFRSPFPWSGPRLRAWNVVVGGFRALIKVDSQRLPLELPSPLVNGRSEIIGGYLDWEETHEYQGMLRILGNMALRAERPKAPR